MRFTSPTDRLVANVTVMEEYDKWERLMQAWLVTWEGPDLRIADDGKLVGIIGVKNSTEFIRRLIRLVYNASISNSSDMKKIAHRPKLWPQVRNTGGRLLCGHSQKWIYARIVSELETINKGHGTSEIVRWWEPDIIEQKAPSFQIRVKAGQKKTLRRNAKVMIAKSWA